MATVLCFLSKPGAATVKFVPASMYYPMTDAPDQLPRATSLSKTAVRLREYDDCSGARNQTKQEKKK